MTKPILTDRPLDEVLPGWGVLVLESHHSPEFSMEWREHDFLKLVYVLRGRGVLEFEDSLVHFGEGDLIVVPPWTPNRIMDAPDAASSLYICCIARRLIEFDENLIQDLSASDRQRQISGDPHLSHRIASLLRRMRHSQSNNDRHVSIAMVSSALRLVEWILQYRATSGRKGSNREGVLDDRDVMEDYVARLRTEFYEATTIDDAAESLDMSRRTFTKLFHEVAGETWLSRVRSLAIRHAKHQLAQTNLSIASVAFECGFNDLSTFYRQFKSQVGMSPKAYRKSIR